MLIDGTCSFCNDYLLHRAPKVFTSHDRDALVCSLCVETFSEALHKEAMAIDLDRVSTETIKMTPSIIKKELDRHVIGQDRAKIALSVAAYNHSKRIESLDKPDSPHIDKSNVLVIGSTGCGKTLLVKHLSNIIDVPFASCDATSFTEAGYVGEDVELALARLLKAADNDVKKAESGIVYIDEIDKLSGSPDDRKTVSTVSVQQTLLKIMEGTSAEVPVSGCVMKSKVTMNTDNILFIMSGAFTGITDQIALKKKTTASIGFSADVYKDKVKDNPDLYEEVQTKDLYAYGLIPEFIGRLPIVVTLSTLQEEDLIRIMTEPDDAIVTQFKELFRLDGVELNFTKAALSAIAKEAMSRESGARGLRSMFEKLLQEPMFSIPDSTQKTVTISRNQVKKLTKA